MLALAVIYFCTFSHVILQSGAFSVIFAVFATDALLQRRTETIDDASAARNASLALQHPVDIT